MTVTALHVLIIEDDQDLLDLLDGHLSRLGCRVSRARSGTEGLVMADSDPPDLVFLDVLLPDVDGREVARRLRAGARTRDCQIVAASVLEPDDLDGMASDAVLTKPFRRASVTAVLDELAARRIQGGP